MSERIYIARALDKSWAAVATSEAHANELIAAHEPDPDKRSGYQILVETMTRLMADEIPGIRRGLQQRLVKWEGEGPIPEDASQHPENYPQVIEVVEGGDGIVTKTIYRREACL